MRCANYVCGRSTQNGPNARGSRATEVERGDRNLAKPLPTSRGVGAVKPRPTVMGGALRVRPRHIHAKSALRGARALWAVGPCSTERKRVGHEPRDSNAGTRTYRSLCCRPASVLAWSSLGQRYREESAPRYRTTQPRQVRTMRRASSVCGRPTQNGPKRARVARHGSRTR